MGYNDEKRRIYGQILDEALWNFLPHQLFQRAPS